MASAQHQLVLAEDPFTEEEHAFLDKDPSLIGNASTINEANILEDGDLVLRVIIRQVKARVAISKPLTSRHLTTLLKTNESLREMLLECVRSGRFSSLRRSQLFRDAVSDMSESPVEDGPGPTAPVRLAWRCEYRGDYHLVMLDNMNATRRNKDYANCLSIIQSSGCGKSRMVDEMAKLVFTIPFNIRDPKQMHGGAYPPDDTAVWEYLCGSRIESLVEAEDRVAWFFQNLFAEVDRSVQEHFNDVQPKQSPSQLAYEWWNHLSGGHRSELYKRVIQGCQPPLPPSPRNSSQIYENLRRLLHRLNNICDFPDNRSIRIVLYFDEAHELDLDIPKEKVKKLYDVVWSMLCKFGTPLVFTLFLSTQSSMTLLAPSAEAARSDRQQKEEVLWGPITETPFDCHPSFPLGTGQYRLADIVKLSFLVRFGRPMFWTMLDKHGDSSELLNKMIRLARKKLIFHDSIDNSNELGPTALLAILDVLITIDYEPRRELARNYQAHMVAGHMRVAFSIPNHRSYMHSGYPSEPFLAEAASRQMCQQPTDMTRLLQDNLQYGLIDLGHRGEVVMRFLLRKAYMDAIIAEQKDPAGTSPNFSQGCSFLVFLEALFAEGFHTEILECRSANNVTSKDSLEDAFKHAIVRFTHFAKAADDSVMTTRGMVMGFLRGAAIIGHNTQKLVDIAIPILLHKDMVIGEASMTALLIQVKRRHRAGTVNAYLIDANELKFFEDSQGSRPYVTLIAELGVKHSEPPVIIDRCGTYESKPRKAKAQKTKMEYPRYSIRAFTCTPRTWRVVQLGEEVRYEQILCTDALLVDHPRHDPSSLQLVRRSLPFWYKNAAWFSGKEDKTQAGPLPVSESDEQMMNIDSASLGPGNDLPAAEGSKSKRRIGLGIGIDLRKLKKKR